MPFIKIKAVKLRKLKNPYHNGNLFHVLRMIDYFLLNGFFTLKFYYHLRWRIFSESWNQARQS
ncbi:hypothetical protein Pat9b_4892 (plasmid) [Pantoea sp. At-9b]|nr:hypothetical protein Pat9b_4892 [Pantoea sp. At-9b]